MNRLLLSARTIERGVKRYTPAGLPALDLVLAHESETSENGVARKVSLELRAVAIGTVTAALEQLALGAPAIYGGFLASTRNGRGLSFHITEVGAVAESADRPHPVNPISNSTEKHHAPTTR